MTESDAKPSVLRSMPPSYEMEQSEKCHVGERIAQWRKLWKMSQRELSRRAGVTNGALSQIEQGKTSPSVQTLEKLALALNMSLQTLLFGRFYAPLSIIRSKDSQKWAIGGARIRTGQLGDCHDAPCHGYLPAGQQFTEADLIDLPLLNDKHLTSGWRVSVLEGLLEIQIGDGQNRLVQGDACYLQDGSGFIVSAPGASAKNPNPPSVARFLFVR